MMFNALLTAYFLKASDIRNIEVCWYIKIYRQRLGNFKKINKKSRQRTDVQINIRQNRTAIRYATR